MSSAMKVLELLLGDPKNRSSINSRVPKKIFHEIPDFISSITLRYDDGTESTFEDLENTLEIDDVSDILRQTDVIQTC